MDDKNWHLRIDPSNYIDPEGEGGFGYGLWLTNSLSRLDIMVRSITPLRTEIRHLHITGGDYDNWEPARIGCVRDGEIVWNHFCVGCKLVYRLERDGEIITTDYEVSGKYYVDVIDSWEQADIEAKIAASPLLQVRDKAEFDAAVQGWPGYARYAVRWGRLMQLEMADGVPIEESAEAASRTADFGGVTELDIQLATHLLVHFWKHGAELLHWHNRRIVPKDQADEATAEGFLVSRVISGS